MSNQTVTQFIAGGASGAAPTRSITNGATGLVNYGGMTYDISGYNPNGTINSQPIPNSALTTANGFTNLDIAANNVVGAANTAQSQEIQAGQLSQSGLTPAIAQAQQSAIDAGIASAVSQMNAAQASAIPIPTPVSTPTVTATTAAPSPVAAITAPASTQTGTASDVATASANGSNAAMQALLSQLANQLAAGTNSGGDASSGSLPPPSAADVASLQPTISPTSSTGVSTAVIIAIVVVVGIGGYIWYKNSHKGE